VCDIEFLGLSCPPGMVHARDLPCRGSNRWLVCVCVTLQQHLGQSSPQGSSLLNAKAARAARMAAGRPSALSRPAQAVLTEEDGEEEASAAAVAAVSGGDDDVDRDAAAATAASGGPSGRAQGPPPSLNLDVLPLRAPAVKALSGEADTMGQSSPQGSSLLHAKAARARARQKAGQ
jgi:hypothetical protein